MTLLLSEHQGPCGIEEPVVQLGRPRSYARMLQDPLHTFERVTKVLPRQVFPFADRDKRLPEGLATLDLSNGARIYRSWEHRGEI